MKRRFLKGFAAAFVVFAVMASAATAPAPCPSFVHKINITNYVDSGYVLPVKGTVVSCFVSGPGLVTAPLGSLNATPIPNTTGDGNCASPAITEDGQWVLYYGNSKLYIIRIDGQFKTQVPVVSLGGGPGPGFGVCTFWYNAPGSTPTNKKLEVAYRASGDQVVHAVPVTISANAAPTFGTDHIVASFGGQISFTIGLAANHFFARINTGGNDCPHMATIPATGNATDADLWVPKTQQIAGCMCIISHDGTIAGYNSGYASWCACLADQTCNFRHHSLTLLPFQENTATAVPWIDTLVKTKAIGVNWAPKQYFSYLPNDTLDGDAKTSDFGPDFGRWSYTNNNEYIVGSMILANWNITPDSLNKAIRSKAPDTGAIWLVHYPTNTWTRILRPLSPISHSTLLDFPAVWIDPSVSVIKSPLQSNSRVNRMVPSSGITYVVDIKGCIVARSDKVMPKLIPGIYYKISPQGAMQRMIVSR
jgi:hypothetical protein